MNKDQFALEKTADRLSLRDSARSDLKPITIDFTETALIRRCLPHKIYGEWVVRAVGVKPRQKLWIIDATAGFGEDSFLLASAGCHVTAIERSLEMHALLQDGLLRAQQHPQLKIVAERIELMHADAQTWLKNLTEKPDVIYLDPMFPERKKTALVKKDMQLLQALVGFDLDAAELLKQALMKAKKRVVVKRPSGASVLGGLIPQGCLQGKRCRYDLYSPVSK